MLWNLLRIFSEVTTFNVHILKSHICNKSFNEINTLFPIREKDLGNFKGRSNYIILKRKDGS